MADLMANATETFLAAAAECAELSQLHVTPKGKEVNAIDIFKANIARIVEFTKKMEQRSIEFEKKMSTLDVVTKRLEACIHVSRLERAILISFKGPRCFRRGPRCHNREEYGRNAGEVTHDHRGARPFACRERAHEIAAGRQQRRHCRRGRC